MAKILGVHGLETGFKIGFSAGLDRQRKEVILGMKAYAAELVGSYQKKWAESPYLGPSELLPSTLEEIIVGFLDDFSIEKGIEVEKE
jgi:hypothetical protein